MNVRFAALCVACLLVSGTGRVSATSIASPSWAASAGRLATADGDRLSAADMFGGSEGRGLALPSPPVSRAAAEAPAASPADRPWWGWVLLGRMHPLVVHFPIGLLTVAAVIEAAHLLRRRPLPSEAATWCLALGLAGAVASVFLGTLNAAHQTVTGDAAITLERHRMLGWMAVVAATAALGVGQLARRGLRARTPLVYLGLVCVTSAVVGATGHLGGQMVYGEEYLSGALPWNQTDAAVSRVAVTARAAVPDSAPRPIKPAAAPAASAAATPAPAATAAPAAGPEPPVAPVVAHQAASVDFARDVKPILEATCVECHGPDKVKARLRMDSVEALQKGGKSGALLKAGDPENSLIMRRVLGLDGEDQMPLDKDPLTEAQIDTLRRWIAAGAPYGAGGSQ
jgi:uncharacterized membrane protein/mono/diheme cytochrome c family protein